MKPPSAELDDYAQTMLMFYLQEHNIPFDAIDYIEVTLRKDKHTKKLYRHIKIVKKCSISSKKTSLLRKTTC